MAGKKTKVVDKWKNKKWYNVLAPPMFEGKEVAEIVTADEEKVANRVVRVSMMELLGTGSQNAMFTILKLRVTDIKGTGANTKLIGYEILPTYIKTFVRRNKSIIYLSAPVKTKDDLTVMIKVIAVTDSKVSQNTKKNLRNSLADELNKATEGFTYDQLMQEAIYGRLTGKLFAKLKSITPMRRVEIRKTELKEMFK